MEISLIKVIDCIFTIKGKVWHYIKEYPDPPPSSEDVQKEFGIKPNTASEHLSDLEKIGLIWRKKIGRKKYIFLTDFSKIFL